MEPIRFCKQYYLKEKIAVHSCGYSCVIHVVILLILALCYTAPSSEKTIHLELSFSSDVLEEVSLETPVADLKISETESPNFNEWKEPEPSTITDAVEQPLLVVDDQLEETNYQSIEKPIPVEYLSATIVDETENDKQEIADTNSKTILQELTSGIESGVRHNNRIAGAATGSNGEVDSRLKSAGAKTGDVQISLSWNTIDDIDLHVKFTPGNGLVDNINWTNRLGRLSNGMLDIDMNANSGFLSATPVENIFWPPKSSPNGVFTVYVHFFRSWSGAIKVPVIVRIKNGDKIEFLQVVAELYSNPQQVKQFAHYPMNKKNSF